MFDIVPAYILAPHTRESIVIAASQCQRRGVSTILVDPTDGSPCGWVMRMPDLDAVDTAVVYHAVLFEVPGRELMPRPAAAVL